MTIFADTLYWVAIANASDPWHQASINAKSTVGEAKLFTTEEVLSEFLTTFASSGPYLRSKAVGIVRSILSDRLTAVIPQSNFSFLTGIALYEARHEKAYSLEDCVSMNAMREGGITDILTNDHHFTQEGFTVLIGRQPLSFQAQGKRSYCSVYKG